MELLEKVVNGLECHGHKGACGEDCPYHAPGERCSEPLCADALTLINAQQERIAELEAELGQRDYNAAVEMQQYCERYEPTYNPEDGSM